MAHGVGRWLSGVRGLWESLCVARDDDLGLIMLQAPPVDPLIVRYLLSLRPGGPDRFADRWSRHTLVNVTDDGERHLSEKVLADPGLLVALRDVVRRARRLGRTVEALSCYASSERMRRIAESLELDLAETHPETLCWGTKSGSRQVFRRAGVEHPPGSYVPAHDPASMARALAPLVARHGTGDWLVKIDAEFGSGHGNALLRVGPSDTDVATLERLLGDRLEPIQPTVSRTEFLGHARRVGAIVERRLDTPRGAPPRFPSVSGHLAPSPGAVSQVRILGTHEQVIGAHQDFVGCRFPAEHVYRAELLRGGRAVLERLAEIGVRGHVGIDFIARPTATTRWSLAALEINLRQTGSSHPNHTVRALVDGKWEADGRLVAPAGHDVSYWSTDSLISPSYVGVTPAALITALRRRPDLRYDVDRTSGVVPHLWTALPLYGKVGATFVAGSNAECERLRDGFVDLLAQLATRSHGP